MFSLLPKDQTFILYFQQGYTFFLFLIQNIVFGYSLELPPRVSTIYVLSTKKVRNIKILQLEAFQNYSSSKNMYIARVTIIMTSTHADTDTEYGTEIHVV